jgi:hypothetical protein
MTPVPVQLVVRGDGEDGVSVPGRRTGGSPSAEAVADAIDPAARAPGVRHRGKLLLAETAAWR